MRRICASVLNISFLNVSSCRYLCGGESVEHWAIEQIRDLVNAFFFPAFQPHKRGVVQSSYVDV